MIELLWGLKTTALLDVWSIEHVVSGISISHLVIKKHQSVFSKKLITHKDGKPTAHFDILGVLFVAYLWETIEHYLETGLAGNAVAYWFQGVEFWPNRIIFDPLMLVLGYYIAKQYPTLIIPARVFTVIWLFVHIFVFPHSMYLHELL